MSANLLASYNRGPHGLSVSWNRVPDALRYEVARSLDQGASWDEDYYFGTEPFFIDTDIDDKSSIYYRVRACSGDVCSDWTSTPSSAQ